MLPVVMNYTDVHGNKEEVISVATEKVIRACNINLNVPEDTKITGVELTAARAEVLATPIADGLPADRAAIKKDLAALCNEINARIDYSQLATIVILSAAMGVFRMFG
jgi:hypothetical protein